MKSPLGAQTVLGDRHDLVCEILFASPVGGPAELARENFPTARQAVARRTQPMNQATTGVDDRSVSEFDLQERSFACDSSIARSLCQ